MLDFPLVGHWSEGNVTATWIASSRPIIPELERAIEAAWEVAGSRPNVHLFNGPMCRLESFDASTDSLRLKLSPTDYKTVVGTNFANAALADRYGQAVLGNGVGLSSAVLSSNGFVLLGKRNERVNYYPSRIHPFSGSLEPGETIDVFAEVRRELREELSLGPDAIESIVCLGIARDRSIRQPEIIFATATRLTREQLQRQLDADEHSGVWTARVMAETLLPPIDHMPQFTPVGIASLLLLGRARFGDAWFAAAAAKLLR